MEPQYLERELKKIDRSLSLERDVKNQRWNVTGTDAKRRKYLIYQIPFRDFSWMAPRVIPALWKLSPAKQGGAKGVNRQMDEQIDRQEKQDEKNLNDALDYAGAEAYDYMQRRRGQRITLPGFTINDYRRVKGEEDNGNQAEND